MSQTIIPNDMVVQGVLTPQGFNPPAACIPNAAITGPIQASNLRQQYVKGFAQTKGAGAAVAQRQIVHVVRGATATLTFLRAVLQQANVGGATVTVDLYKNGSSILSATMTITNATAAYTVVSTSAFTSTALVAGDVLEIVVTVATGGGTLGQGLQVDVEFNEDPN